MLMNSDFYDYLYDERFRTREEAAKKQKEEKCESVPPEMTEKEAHKIINNIFGF